MIKPALEKKQFHFQRALQVLRATDLMPRYGRVRQVIGTVIESHGPAMAIGETCMIRYQRNALPVLAEVVGFRDNRVLLMPLGELSGIGAGSEVQRLGHPLHISLSPLMLGRVFDGLGRAIDNKEELQRDRRVPVLARAPDPLRRPRITVPLPFGIRAIDSMLTCGRGQRIGIFAGSGVGKSTILGMIARNSTADVNVIALVGERGKEVRDFIDRDLGEDGLKRSVVVVATSDQPALVRIRAAYVATTIAEYFRDQGKHVMLMMDSVTRFAMAQREIGLAIGEPTTTRGYTPSVFAELPKLMERAGTSEKGTVTGLYAVLVDGDDLNEPVSDAVRSILDGHIVLSRALASANHYPAIDILASVSRVMPDIVSPEHRMAASSVRDMLATYREAEDLINIGAYVQGSSKSIDRAIGRIDAIRRFLCQGIEEKCDYQETISQITGLGL